LTLGIFSHHKDQKEREACITVRMFVSNGKFIALNA
jgi:hypothetical protein